MENKEKNMIDFNRFEDRLSYVNAFRSGMHAYTRGSKLENNPYKQGTVWHLGWKEGWEEAEVDWRLAS